MHCADQQIAVATLSGPDGDTVVHVGSRLGAGTVSRIDPYLVVVTSASGVQNIKFDIPTASLDERIPTIASGDGDAKAAMVIRAKAPESEKALAQNMTALQAALEAAQVQRKSLEPPNKQKPLIKPTSTGSGPSH
jgi:pyridoxal/pyridoxine/pyridoxamine kinase